MRWLFYFIVTRIPVSLAQNRRSISFEEDIVDDVFEKFGGTVSKSRIRYIFRSSIMYLVNSMRYTSATEMRVPFLGYLICNKGDMLIRYHYLERLRRRKTFSLPPDLKAEFEALEAKIAAIEEGERKGLYKRGDKHIADMRNLRYNLKRKMPFEAVEDLQDREFY